MNQIAHSFYNNQGTLQNIQSLIVVRIGIKSYCQSIPIATKIWTPTQTSSISEKTRENLQTWPLNHFTTINTTHKPAVLLETIILSWGSTSRPLFTLERR
jgi:hypothetical protein